MIKGTFTLPHLTPIGDMLIASTNPPDQATFGSPTTPLRIAEADV